MSPEKDSSNRRERRRAKRAEKGQTFRIELPSLPFLNSRLGRSATAVALVALVYFGSRTFFDEPSRPPENAPMVDQLKYSDIAIKQHPDRAAEEAKRIFVLATRDVCAEVLCDPRKFENSNTYLSNQEYRQGIISENGCKNPQESLDSGANSNFFTNDITFNIEGLSRNLFSNQPWATPGSVVYIESGHEILHANAPLLTAGTDEKIRDETGALVQLKFHRGLLSIAENPANALPGKQCFRVFRSQIEEVVVQDAIEKIAIKSNLANLPVSYPRLIALYRSRVLEPYFGNNNHDLLMLQQRSDHQAFFAKIGERLGAGPNYVDQIMKGESYMASIFSGQPLN